MPYSDKVLEHYERPKNVGSLDKADPSVGTGIVGAPECGDVMKLQLKISPITNVIEHTVETVNRLREMSPLWELAQEGVDLKSVVWSP